MTDDHMRGRHEDADAGNGHGHRGHRRHEHDDAGLSPTVYVLQREVLLGARTGGDEIRAAIQAFAAAFVDGLAAGGCRLIGHVKGVFEEPSGERMYFNATSFSGGVTIRGAVGAASVCRLTVNAIVFGITEAAVERAALEALEPHFGPGAQAGAAGSSAAWRGEPGATA